MNLGEWFEYWVHPVIDAATNTNQQAFDAARERIMQAERDALLNDDQAQALKFILAYYYLVFTRTADLEHEQQDAIEAAFNVFSKPSCGMYSSLFKRRYELQFRILADQMGHPLSNKEFELMLASLPPSERHAEQWFYISRFCFLRGKPEEIAKAYEDCIINGCDWAREYNWRRLEVMHRLLERRATTRDIELLINSTSQTGMLDEIEDIFWAAMEACKIDLGRVQRSISRRRAEIIRLMQADTGNTAALKSEQAAMDN